MLVSVTGGTGFVGAHSVAAIVAAGHRVRLLVRDEARVGPALAPLNTDLNAVEVVTGDVTDDLSVRRLVWGADAVLHAASVYSFDSRRHSEMRRVNEQGTANVLAAARRSGAGRILHVSSVVALYPSAGRLIGADSPVGRPREPYMASKAAAERVARRHQHEGAPVLITYPPALLGPHDPHLGDQTTRLRNALRGLMPMWPSGGFPVGDVRDTAAAHLRLLTGPEYPPDRSFGPGRYLTTRQYLHYLREATGRSLPALFLPARAMLPVGRVTGVLQHLWPWHIPAEYGAIYTCAHATPVNAFDESGIYPRPWSQTLGDTIRWMYGAGLLTARQIGLLHAGPAGAGSPLQGADTGAEVRR